MVVSVVAQAHHNIPVELKEDDKNKRAWLYYRLSRDEDQEMNSLHNQRQILVDYAEQHGYEIVGESFDDNVTGMTFNREGISKIEDQII
ncbi:MAG: recombinase family protein [Ruminococcus sp.]|nr:recombinase family protein [Ruminococcus sp.]